jgi:hypothetical protein
MVAVDRPREERLLLCAEIDCIGASKRLSVERNKNWAQELGPRRTASQAFDVLEPLLRPMRSDLRIGEVWSQRRLVLVGEEGTTEVPHVDVVREDGTRLPQFVGS